MPKDRTVTDHFLVIEQLDETDNIVNIVHPGCVFEDRPIGEGIRWRVYPKCLIDQYLSYSGFDFLYDQNGDEVNLHFLPSGRYPLTFESRYYPGEHGGTWGEEWEQDLWIDTTKRED